MREAHKIPFYLLTYANDMNLTQLNTEQQNPATLDIDTLPTEHILRIINQQDATITQAIASQIPAITQAVDTITTTLEKGGRLIYIGAGTSGRLGILDASECPPTYGTDPNQIIGIIAGGERAITQAVENAEDDREQAVIDLKAINLTATDTLVAIAASGRTPYALAAIEYAKQLGAPTVALTCTDNNPMQQTADIAITPVVGAEVVTGSTRMKAGTAQKLVLNMLTTATMIKRGKVYKNLMVDVRPTNAKLIQRQKNIVCAATGCDENTATHTLHTANGETKTAIVMLLLNTDAETARQRLADSQGHIRHALT